MRGVGEIKGLWKRGLLSSRYSPSLSSEGETTGADEEVAVKQTVLSFQEDDQNQIYLSQTATFSPFIKKKGSI